jgi:Zn-dependent alcohol dehydrogenase
MLSLLERCTEYYRQGHIQPIYPVTIFDAADVRDAFRFMQRGKHIGKIVIQMPSNPALLPVTLHLNPVRFSSKGGAYLLVGGLGGLGRSISTWMAENGARHFVYLSRTAGTTADDQDFFNELHAIGCTVTAVTGDVSDLSDVERVAVSSAHPIVGVIQLSMALKV